MNVFQRIASLALIALVSACASNTTENYERCIVGTSVLGGAVGAAGSGGSAAVGGIAVGALAGGIICQPAEPDAAPAVVAAPVETDSDGDGVSDSRDDCPDTPAGVRVNSRGCPLDSDRDGVVDYRDACPNTPRGVDVDGRGCPLAEEILLTVDRLGFEFDSAKLDAASRAALDAAVDVIRSHSDVQLDVVGYTDSSGPEAYNQGLSERRARAAVDYLVSRGVDAGQLNPVGRGEANPVASNDTRDGRSQNRRVELVVR